MNYYGQSYTSPETLAAQGIGGLFAGLFIFIIIVGLICGIITLIGMFKLFEKAGKPGWYAIIPIYNIIVMLDIVGFKWYYIFLLLLSGIPFIGTLVFIFISVVFAIKLAKSFGQSIPFGIGLALVPIVFYLIIAFDKKIEYKGKLVDGDIDFNDLF